MSAPTTGALIGLVLGVISAFAGFWWGLLAGVLAGVGAAIGMVVEGRIDLTEYLGHRHQESGSVTKSKES